MSKTDGKKEKIPEKKAKKIHKFLLTLKLAIRDGFEFHSISNNMYMWFGLQLERCQMNEGAPLSLTW